MSVDAPVTEVATCLPVEWTLADLQSHLGDIPLGRILLYPPPGMAKVADLLAERDHRDRVCELIDGTLVEKDMGLLESRVAFLLGNRIEASVSTSAVGFVTVGDGPLCLFAEQVRLPDVAFVRWERLPDRRIPQEPVPNLAPDLAVEVLSKGNTRREMERKLRDYFTAGVRLVWYIDPETRSARVYTAPDQFTAIDEHGTLDGGDVLPGFSIQLGPLLDQTAGPG